MSPLLNLWMCHLGGLLLFPFVLRVPADQRTGGSFTTFVGFSVGLSVLLMVYNYAWLKSAHFVPVALTNAVFQTTRYLHISVFERRTNASLSERLSKARLRRARNGSYEIQNGSTSYSLSPIVCGLSFIIGETATTRKCMASIGIVIGALVASGFTNVNPQGVCFGFLAAIGNAFYQMTIKFQFGAHFASATMIRLMFSMALIHLVAFTPLIFLIDRIGWEVMVFPRYTACAL